MLAYFKLVRYYPNLHKLGTYFIRGNSSTRVFFDETSARKTTKYMFESELHTRNREIRIFLHFMMLPPDERNLINLI